MNDHIGHGCPCTLAGIDSQVLLYMLQGSMEEISISWHVQLSIHVHT